jgi:nitroreductase
MEFSEVINRRRTVRDFKNKEIPETILSYAIENAFKAPTYNHMRDWDFIIVNTMEAKMKLIESENLEKEIDVKALEQLFENEDEEKKEMYLDAIPKQKRMILNAKVDIIVIYKPKTTVKDAKKVYDLNCLASVWCCIENFLLSLAEHDIHGVTFIPQNTEKIKSKFNIPQELEVAAVIPIGYKADDAKIIKQKIINVPERVHWNGWSSLCL